MVKKNKKMIDIKIISLQDTKNMNIIRKIRYEVFCIEQKVSPEGDWDNKLSENYLLYYDNKPCATMRYRQVGRCVKLERLCVLQEYRNKKLATILIKKVMEDVKHLSNKTLLLHAQVYLLKFYENLGFVKHGKIFTEEGIQHYTMTFQNH